MLSVSGRFSRVDATLVPWTSVPRKALACGADLHIHTSRCAPQRLYSEGPRLASLLCTRIVRQIQATITLRKQHQKLPPGPATRLVTQVLTTSHQVLTTHCLRTLQQTSRLSSLSPQQEAQATTSPLGDGVAPSPPTVASRRLTVQQSNISGGSR